ncbi:Rho guanine nucleotide exchange factor 26 [Galemys pyrenaicus]|uniref:Rho guanine nucleotide exchange factor 26 n=1 Tax=Galemys pyrenaicus TaxID=202257 RepID=A0A8J6A4G1_GALPY|nr:Rho guanine nucleotide exchange factor 26 [Galemys pyrenaicus]
MRTPVRTSSERTNASSKTNKQQLENRRSAKQPRGFKPCIIAYMRTVLPFKIEKSLNAFLCLFRFFTELEARHQNNIFIDDISDIVEKHSTSTFDPYVKYCTNEVYQQRTLQKLLATNPSFKEVLSRIESHEDCRNLPMISFLILPMQRVTRLPLLMDTICQKTPKDSPKYEVCKRALKEVSKLVRLCNEGARKMERTEMMYTINSQLEFKIKPFPLVSSSRWLVKRGELTAYVEDMVLFSRRTSKQQVYFFLFNDVLIITKKKSEESYNVNDYSLRDQLLVESCDNEELTSSPGKNSSTMLYSRQSSANHLFTLTVLSNHANDKVEMLLGAETQVYAEDELASCLFPVAQLTAQSIITMDEKTGAQFSS